MSDPANDPLIGSVLKDTYRVDALLGQGSMGAVYQGVQLTVNRDVAVKVLHKKLLADPRKRKEMVSRFKREALATSSLSHPNTVRLIEFGETEQGMLFLVLELLRGKTLRDLIDAEAPLSPGRSAHVARQICRSLSEAHANGIVHRDLKPDNVFLCDLDDDLDFVKVMDFGIARVALAGATEEQLTGTGYLVGTPRYISPEQAMSGEITPRTDLYALGVILFEMLSGHVPFDAGSPIEMAIKHMSEEAPPLAVEGMAEEDLAPWRDLCQRLLCKDPAERPESAASVAAELKPLVGSHQTRGNPAAAAGAATVSMSHDGPSHGDAGAGQVRGATEAAVASGRRAWGVIAVLACLVLALAGYIAWDHFGAAAPDAEPGAASAPVVVPVANRSPDPSSAARATAAAAPPASGEAAAPRAADAAVAARPDTAAGLPEVGPRDALTGPEAAVGGGAESGGTEPDAGVLAAADTADTADTAVAADAADPAAGGAGGADVPAAGDPSEVASDPAAPEDDAGPIELADWVQRSLSNCLDKHAPDAGTGDGFHAVVEVNSKGGVVQVAAEGPAGTSTLALKNVSWCWRVRLRDRMFGATGEPYTARIPVLRQ